MTTQTKYYRVAEHSFAIEGLPGLFRRLPNYEPFLVDEIRSTHVFTIRMNNASIPGTDGWEHVYTDVSDQDMPRIEMYKRDERWLFRCSLRRDAKIVCAMICSKEWSRADVFSLPENERFAIDNAAMLLYAFSTADKRTLLFHSSVVVRQERAFMFLGHSGAGKSTHSQQWLAAFSDARLLNDDNPVLRIFADGIVKIYGSPWSGKTPCYKNESAPLGALIQIEQAPENKITSLTMAQAYPFILSSVSGLKILPEMMDRLFESIAALLEISPVFKLECLPNKEAAQLCCATILTP